MAIRQIKSGKAAGPENIPAEALKANVAVTAKILRILFSNIWDEEQVPKDWKEGLLIKIPTKGDLSKCDNYRDITLLSIPGKFFNRVLLNRMKNCVDAQLRDQQAGFRKRGIQWTSKMQLYDLDFAADLALLSQTQQQMQEKMSSVAAASAAVDLNIHKGKNKILRYNIAYTNPVKIDGEDLEDVKTFTYLGSMIDEQGGSDAPSYTKNTSDPLARHYQQQTTMREEIPDPSRGRDWEEALGGDRMYIHTRLIPASNNQYLNHGTNS
ncbi:unnamed protein product [Schistosoma mattheei]|uniref:Uncharacterized protein n=1 Tax=Schistosoma mattheei TaxID=31246 RepID=A0A183Q1E8_9TREM|nr:unnamed protein product [Schistosoma mattheei]